MFKLKYLYFWVCVFLSNASFSMEKEGKGENLASGMTEIKLVKDIEPFVGRVIAYKALSSFINKSNRYLLSENHQYKFGIVNGYLPEYNFGFIDSLIKKGQFTCFNVLTNSNVSEGLHVRYATLEEKAAIKEAILSDKASFECRNKKNALTFFE